MLTVSRPPWPRLAAAAGAAVATGALVAALAGPAAAYPPPPPAAPPPSGAFPTPVQTVTVTNSGGSVSGTVPSSGTDTTVNVQVPAGALPSGTKLSINAPNTGVVDAYLPTSAQPQVVAAFAITWTAANGTKPTATKPIVVTVKDPSIHVGDVVWELTPRGLIRWPSATAGNGSVTILFSGDPGFVVLPKTVSVPPGIGLHVSGHNPIGHLDEVSHAGNGLKVRGWAEDPDTAHWNTVHVYIDGKPVKAIRAATYRHDVGAHGFTAIVRATPGHHTVCTFAINQGRGDHNPLFGCKKI